MKDDFNIEDELADSIARIVNEETTGAEVFMKNNSIQSDDITNKKDILNENEAEPDEDSDGYEPDEEDGREKKSHKKVIIISAVSVVLVAIIATVLFLVLSKAYNNTKDNYAYYNSQAYTAYDDKNYEDACEFFEKALTYDEGKNNTDMMLYLYESYVETEQNDKAEAILYKVLEFDDDNYYNAMYHLVENYEEAEDYKSIAKLYNDNMDRDEDILKLFAGYIPKAPTATPEAGEYSSNQEVALTSADDDVTIYYTTNGTNPTEASLKYKDKIEIKEGTTTIKYYAVNEYGIASETVSQEYTVNYSAPTIPVISPSTTSFAQTEPVNVTISNFSSGSTVYYTLDGTEPNQNSTVYSGPFEIPAGSIIVNVLVVNEYGLSTRTSRTYNVVYTNTYTQEECLELIQTRLLASNTIKEEDGAYQNSDGDECTLSFFSKKDINGNTIYMFYFVIDGAMQDYWYGADANTGTVYTIRGTEGSYTLTQI